MRLFILVIVYIVQISSAADLEQRACVSFHVGAEFFRAFGSKMVDQYLQFWNHGVNDEEYNFQKTTKPFGD